MGLKFPDHPQVIALLKSGEFKDLITFDNITQNVTVNFKPSRNVFHVFGVKSIQHKKFFDEAASFDPELKQESNAKYEIFNDNKENIYIKDLSG